MNIKLLKEVMDKLSDAGQRVNVSLYIFLRYGRVHDPFDVRKLSIGKSLVAELRKTALSTVKKVVDDVAAGSLKMFYPDLAQDQFFMKTEKIPDFNDMRLILIQANPPVYLKVKAKEEDMKAWVMRFELELGGKTRQLFLFQRFSPARMVKRKGICFYEQGGVYEIIPNNFLTINEEVDAVVFDDHAVALDRSDFEFIFRFELVYKRGAQEVLQVLENNELSKEVAIENVQILSKEFLTSTRNVRKLYRINQNNFFKNIKLQELRDLNNWYDLKLEFSGNTWRITEQTPPGVVLNILNDEYNRSMITDNEYRSEAKEKLSRVGSSKKGQAAKGKKTPKKGKVAKKEARQG
jgi:hypothetical protein